MASAAGLILCGSALAGQGHIILQPGLYEVNVRLEVPNVTNWESVNTVTFCLPADSLASEVPFKVMSGNNPLSNCPVELTQRSGAWVRFQIVCEGRNASRARAIYKLQDAAFTGRIAMVMGAKNMTMTEVQTGRRVGACLTGDASPD